MTVYHQPVMVKEVLHFLSPKEGGLYIDCTLGDGGHSEAILRATAGRARLVGIDRDPEAIEAAAERLDPYKDSIRLVHGVFSRIVDILSDLGCRSADGILFDLGISSRHVDKESRGFSYNKDAPLDMRMDPATKMTAADLVNQADVDTLTRILWEYGEERWARRIAGFIVAARRNGPVRTTGQLVDIVRAAIPRSARSDGPHPAKRTFQALRIAVNGELDELKQGLEGACSMLSVGEGKVVVISYHSLEDRITKQIFRRLSGHCTCHKGLPACMCGAKRILEVLTKRPVTPREEEVRENPRARSAKMRAARRTAAQF